MNPTYWNNFLTYSLQVGLLVGIAGCVPALARLRSPHARLWFFQTLLAVCVLLPALRPWKVETIAIVAPARESLTLSAPAQPIPAHLSWDFPEAALAAVGIGFVVRLAMLGLGMLRLRRYRLGSIPMRAAGEWGKAADILISPEVSGPVTFGFWRPVILLPAEFPDLAAELREAILCHETLHVRRGDWLFTLAEELVRAGLWFHPAIWWLLGEIQLAREQAVDREAVDMTNAREPYVDALLAAAGAAVEADLAPAPLFLRKRQLKQRVVSILKEKPMSRTRTVSTLAASLAILAGACWFLTGALPLSADPQLANDSRGITVDLMGAQVMHRAPVFYPPAAMEKKVEGVVTAQVKLDDNGNVTDASILSGPEELRKPVLQSLLSWHFMKDVAGTTRQVSVRFTLPSATATPAPAVTGEKQTISITASALPPPANAQRKGVASETPAGPRVIRSITVHGIGMPADELIAKLPVRINDEFTPETMAKIQEAVHQIDEHLSTMASFLPPNGVEIRIMAPPAPPMPTAQNVAPPGTITVGGRVQSAKLISNPPPVYPDLARQARISGTVELGVIISPDGHMQEIHVISGHPLLRQAALDAVKQWVYAPTLLNGQPVAVSTTVNVIFTLGQ